MFAEVTVQRGPGHAELTPGFAERQRFDALAADGPDGLVDERPPQVAVVVTAGGLSDSRASRTGGERRTASDRARRKDTFMC